MSSTQLSLLIAGATLVAVAMSANVFAKSEFATKDEATTMVKKGVIFIKANGADKG